MVKKVGPELRELALVARGSQDTGSSNLGAAFLQSLYRVGLVVWQWVGLT